MAKDDITERESYFSYEYNRICVGCILLRSMWTETGKDIRADTRSCIVDAVFMQDYYMRLSGLWIGRRFFDTSFAQNVDKTGICHQVKGAVFSWKSYGR